MSNQLIVGNEGALVPLRRFAEVMVPPGPEGLLERLFWIVAPPTATQRMAIQARQASAALREGHAKAMAILDQVQIAGQQVTVNSTILEHLQKVGACAQALILLDGQNPEKTADLNRRLDDLIYQSGQPALEGFLDTSGMPPVLLEAFLEVVVAGATAVSQDIIDLEKGVKDGTKHFSQVMTWLADARSELRKQHAEMLRLNAAQPILRIFQHAEEMQKQAKEAGIVITDIEAQRKELRPDPSLRPDKGAIRAGIESSAQALLGMPEEEASENRR